MKQSNDHFTVDFLNRPGPGRPRKPDAKSDAQRMREYRARKKKRDADLLQEISVTRYENSEGKNEKV